VDADGKPIPGVEVSAGDRGQPRCETVADDQGRFCAEGLCEGLVCVSAGLQGPPRREGASEACAGDRDVKVVLHDDDVPSISWRDGKAIYGSLRDRTLPDLKDLSADLPQAGLADKPILLCLVDIDGDPKSRECLKDLAKMSETLTAGGVTVAVVQIPGVSPIRYDDWLADNRVPFHVYPGQRSFEGKKLEWGVNSLPWLILANRKHIVVADGLSVSGLSAVLHRAR
jgi:hypothetical protein